MSSLSVKIDYTNWRGERRVRRVQPDRIVFESSEWHPEPQWVLRAIDLEDEDHAEKAFAMSGVHSWENERGPGTTSAEA
jgi:hypothetical protein